MATDLSLPRLRELLQRLSTLCDDAHTELLPIVETITQEDTYTAWFGKNQPTIAASILISREIENMMSNAATLCDKLRLDGDAVQLRAAGIQITAIVSDILSASYPMLDAETVNNWREYAFCQWFGLQKMLPERQE